MEISELFYSIQGEGKRSGCPSFFIRTNYCNLRCKFKSGNLCDTAYTSWFPLDEKNLGDKAVNFIVDEYKKINCRDVVISGGEPTIYPDELEFLCGELKKTNKEIFITIESNGTSIGDFVNYIDMMSISPKLKSSIPYNTEYEKMHSKNRFNPDVFRKYNSLKQNCAIDIQWKFVFTGLEDIVEILALQMQVEFENKDVYLMPEGISEEDLKRNRLMTIEACKKFDFNYTDRIHIIVWGNKRGI